MVLMRINAGMVIAALGTLWLMPTATADVPKGVYAGIEGGVAWTGPLTFEPFYYNCTTLYPCALNYNSVNFDVGYAAGVQVGYAFGGPRVEFEYNYRNNGADTIASPSGTQSASGSLTSNNFMVNLFYDFDTGSRWVPYVGFGLGLSDLSASTIKPSSATGSASSYIDGGGNKFSAQFIFGIEYAVSERFGVTLDWRGLWATSVSYTYGVGCTSGSTTNCTQTGTTTYDYWSGALNIGLRVKF
jgi:opacity protein-like surface antigen